MVVAVAGLYVYLPTATLGAPTPGAGKTGGASAGGVAYNPHTLEIKSRRYPPQKNRRQGQINQQSKYYRTKSGGLEMFGIFKRLKALEAAREDFKARIDTLEKENEWLLNEVGKLRESAKSLRGSCDDSAEHVSRLCDFVAGLQSRVGGQTEFHCWVTGQLDLLKDDLARYRAGVEALKPLTHKTDELRENLDSLSGDCASMGEYIIENGSAIKKLQEIVGDADSEFSLAAKQGALFSRGAENLLNYDPQRAAAFLEYAITAGAGKGVNDIGG